MFPFHVSHPVSAMVFSELAMCGLSVFVTNLKEVEVIDEISETKSLCW